MTDFSDNPKKQAHTQQRANENITCGGATTSHFELAAISSAKNFQVQTVQTLTHMAL